jgi:hypothetical protein
MYWQAPIGWSDYHRGRPGRRLTQEGRDRWSACERSFFLISVFTIIMLVRPTVKALFGLTSPAA